MGSATSGERPPKGGDNASRPVGMSRAIGDQGAETLKVIDGLADSFPLLPGESQWLMTLMADELARILADD